MIFALVSFVVTMLLMPLFIRLAHRFGLHDTPDMERKDHASAIPYTGGFSIILATGVALAALWIFGDRDMLVEQTTGLMTMYLYIAEAAVIIFILGILDDFVELSFAKKFLFQFLAATFIILGAMRSDVYPRVFSVQESGVLINSVGTIISLLWIVGVTNAINMIDGMDGLAGGSVLLSSASMAVLTWMWGNELLASALLILSGAVLGFLVFNKPPAKIFMGDTGSMFLGFILAVGGWILVDATSGKLTHFFIPVILLGLPISDTLLAFFRRVITGQNPFSADTFHIHHMLKHRFQLSTPHTVFILWGISLVYCVTGITIAFVPEFLGWILISGLIALKVSFLHILGYTEFLKNRKGELKHPPVYVRKNGNHHNGTRNLVKPASIGVKTKIPL